jgi:prepilin-type N-terminal cleavage/methylation domain-containing protein
MKKIQKQKKGFTLLEILLVIALIGILVTIIIVVLNPKSRFESARNDTRQSDIKKIEAALIQYRLQEGSYPAGLTTTLQEICDPDIANPSTNCGININLSALVPIYLQSIPQDPNDKDTTGGNGYKVAVDTTRNIVAVKAIQAESSATISINDPLPGETTVTANTPLAATVPVVPPPPIVTNGLVLNLDAGNPASYPGTGTTWTDLSGNSNNGTLVNGPTYNSANGGVIALDGVNDYIDVPINLTNTNYTIMGAARYVVVGGRTFSAKNNNWLMGHWSVSTQNHYAEGWVSDVQSGPSDTNWRIYAAIGNYSGDSWAHYVNGVLNAGPNTGGSNGPNGFAIGSYLGSSEFSNSHISNLLVYNRVLTAAEVQQNFNAMRGRYGL